MQHLIFRENIVWYYIWREGYLCYVYAKRENLNANWTSGKDSIFMYSIRMLIVIDPLENIRYIRFFSVIGDLNFFLCHCSPYVSHKNSTRFSLLTFHFNSNLVIISVKDITCNHSISNISNPNCFCALTKLFKFKKSFLI